MGQASSQEIQESPVSPVKKAPPRPQEPPKLQVQPTPRPPSYAVPENKVLPTELPSKPLRAVSSAFAKSNPEFEKLFVDKENKPLENGSVKLDHNFFPERNKTDERNDSDTDIVILRNKEKYKAPSPPVASVLPVNSQGDTRNIPIDPFYNRAALAHRRTHSLDRIPGNRVNGHPRRPVSAVNLTSSEHTIFEDPEEANQNNKYTSLPQKSTFPMDYSYAVTYAQLAGHRRKHVQPKLETEKEVLLKRQSLPDLQENKDMDQNIDMYLTRDGEIDLDNLTPRRKKYKAPAPPSIPQVSKQAIVLQNSSSASQNKVVSVSRHRKQTAPEEPPVDYDTGEIATSTVNHQKQSVESITSNGKAVVSPMSADMKVIGLQNLHSKETIAIDKKRTQTSSPKLIIQRQSSSIEPASPTSPKSPPPPVKPKPIRSPDEGRFRFPNSPSKPETDVVTVNGQVIPEVRGHPPVHEVVSLSIDSKSEIVRAAIVTPVPTQTIPPSPQSPMTEVQRHPSVILPVASNEASYPIQRESRGTIHLGAESKTEGTPAASNLNSINLLTKQNSVDVTKQSTSFPESPAEGDNKVTSEKGLKSFDKSYELEQKPPQMGSPVADIKPIPIGLATDIVLDTSSVCDSNPPTVSQSQSGSDSGVNMPLSDQSFESLTTGDRSMEMEGTTVADDEPTSTATEQVSQGTMTITPEIIEDKREPIIKTRQLDRSLSTSSSDSAKPISPPLTPDDKQPPKMNSLLQNDIVAAAQVRVLKLKKPASAPPRPKHPDEVFKEELAKLHKERERRLSKSLSVENDGPSDNVESENIQEENTKDDVSTDKDTDSGIQACSFSEDWTPEHDLEDSDDEHRSAHTSRSGFFYDGRKGKPPVKATNSSSSGGRVRLLRKSDSDVSDKFGSLRRFRQNVHKSVKHALSSVNKQSSKPSKLDKRSSLPPPASSSSEPQQPVFRKLDPDAPQQPMNNREQKDVSENGINTSQVEKEKMTEGQAVKQSDTDQQVMKKAGVAYVSGNAQIVVLPEFESPKSSSDTGNTDDVHRAPKRWKKVKKFAYMATTRKKEKQRMEQLLKERVEEQERRMEEERIKQLEMEREFMKVRQVDQPAIKSDVETNGTPSKKGNSPKRNSPPEVPQNAANQRQVSVNSTAQGQITANGTPQGQVTLNGLQSSTVASFTMPGLVQAPNLVTASQPAVNPLLLNGQAYNPWLAAQPVQNLAYPTTIGWGIPNYAAVPAQYTTSMPYDLTNYMQMLDINGQSVNMPLNNGLINGYNVASQSLDRNQTNGLIHINGATGYSAANGTPLQQQNSVEANNYNNNRSLKQTIYVNPGPIDDSVLNQMYAEYQNGNRNPQFKGQDKNRSNPLYYSSDEEEEYDVSDVHTGRTHSKGTVARISVPDHHTHQIQPVHYADEEMSSPCSVTSSSADSGTRNYPIKLNGTVPHQSSVPPAYFRSGSTSDPVNLDESYSSADR